MYETEFEKISFQRIVEKIHFIADSSKLNNVLMSKGIIIDEKLGRRLLVQLYTTAPLGQQYGFQENLESGRISQQQNMAIPIYGQNMMKQILTNIVLYLVTNYVVFSSWIYRGEYSENSNKLPLKTYTIVPTGQLDFLILYLLQLLNQLLNTIIMLFTGVQWKKEGILLHQKNPNYYIQIIQNVLTSYFDYILIYNC